MLELIFKGFVEWFYEMTLECWEYFSGTLLDILNMDFTYLRTHVPVVDTIMQIMLAVGWALLLGNLVFQAIKSMASGLGFEAEDPKLLFTRTFAFSFLLLASPQICRIGLSITQNIINILQIPDAVDITFADESIFGGIKAAWLLVIIIGIIVMFKVFKLILKIAEQYVILGMLTICAPLAFGVGGSRSTSDIFTGWCRMFASMCFVMVSNVIFFKMLLSVLSYVPTGLDVLPWMVLVFAITKVAGKVDAIVTRIGLNPAITGDSMGRGLPGMLTYAVIRAATKRVVQTAGKNTGGGVKGTSPKSPPGGGVGGGSRTGNPINGSRFTRSRQYASQTAGTQNNYHHNISEQQSGAKQSGSQNSSAAYSSSAQSNTVWQEETTRQSIPWVAEQTGSTRPGAADRTNPSFNNQADRKSAVPPGARRSASYVRQQNGMAGMAASATVRNAGQRTGTPTGTAGTEASGIRAQSDRPSQNTGGAEYANTENRTAQSFRPGARRSASYVRQQNGMAGMAASATVRNAGQRTGTPTGTAGTEASGIRAQSDRPSQNTGGE